MIIRYFVILLNLSIIIHLCNADIRSHCENYFATGPDLIRPNQQYKVAVHFGECLTNELIKVSLSIKNNHEQLVCDSIQDVFPEQIQLLTLQIPSFVVNDSYHLHVEGKIDSKIIFSNTTILKFDTKFLAVVVQASRPLYAAGDTVRFRVILLNKNLTYYDNDVEVFILDPDNYIMRRWITLFSNNGVITLKYKLPDLTKDGYWKIRIKIQKQIEEYKFKVETYFPPLFEVYVNLPPYITDNNEEINGEIYGLFKNENHVKGNLSLELFISGNNNSNEDFSSISVWKDNLFLKNKIYKLKLPMDIVTRRRFSPSSSTNFIEITVKALLTDFMSLETIEGFCKSRIISVKPVIKFLTPVPSVFKPGMPFHTYIAVNYEDNGPLEKKILKKGKLYLQITLINKTGTIIWPQITFNSSLNDIVYDEIIFDPYTYDSFTTNGILGFKFQVPYDIDELHLLGSFEIENGHRVETRLKSVKYASNVKGQYLSVTSSTRLAVAREFAIFHIKTNYEINSLQYLVVSKGEILEVGTMKNLKPFTVKTISLAVSPEMGPGLIFIVFHVTEDNHINSDSIYLPVKVFNLFKMEFGTNSRKDYSGEKVEFKMTSRVGAYIGVQGLREINYKLQLGNELTLSRIVDKFYESFQQPNRTYNKIIRRSRTGSTADESLYYPTMNSGQNSIATFTSINLAILSYSGSLKLERFCGNSDFPCMSGLGCFNVSQICDGVNNCHDFTDESNCLNENDDYDYKINRMSHTRLHYDNEVGDWGYTQIWRNDLEGAKFQKLKVPMTENLWYFIAFTISEITGLSIIEQPVTFKNIRPLTAWILGPETCRHGEQIGLQVTMHNPLPLRSHLLIRLLASKDYKFVRVGSNGIVSSYSPKLSDKEVHIMIYMPPLSEEHVDIPIVPTIDQGEVTINIIVSSMATKVLLSHTVQVLTEGATIEKHTSVTLDLQSRAFTLTYLDLFLEESPIIPYREWRNFIYGSSSASVTITDDLIGPVFTQIPMLYTDYFGQYNKGSEGRIFEFAMNIWTLHYLRITNKIENIKLKQVLNEINTVFAHVMKRYNKNGFFTNWDTSTPSVWLTSWILRIFKFATYADWENILYIDDQIFQQGTEWILQHQINSGNFIEWNNSSNYEDVSLTAHVMITLNECLSVLKGITRIKAIEALQRSLSYLNYKIRSLEDPYDIALTSYVLLLTRSDQVEVMHNKLNSLARYTNDGLIYWSFTKIESNPIKLENQRPFLNPRDAQHGDSKAVETTAYALLFYLSKYGVTPFTDKITQWINTMRTSYNVFVSATDTVVATQALIEYVNQARLIDLTKINVSINIASADTYFHETYKLGNNSKNQYYQNNIPTTWGHINVVGQGSGYALIQLHQAFGVDYDTLLDVSTVPIFELKVQEYYSQFRNKTAVTIQSCFRCIAPEKCRPSILEIEIPSGYYLVESEAIKIYHPNLKDAKTIPGKTVWYFDEIPRAWSCFNHTVRRWFPVANMTLYRQAFMYEMNARENFIQVLFNSTPLYVLNICEVCGSYQCPYCPYYNLENKLRPLLTIVVISISISINYNFFFLTQ